MSNRELINETRKPAGLLRWVDRGTNTVITVMVTLLCLAGLGFFARLIWEVLRFGWTAI